MHLQRMHILEILSHRVRISSKSCQTVCISSKSCHERSGALRMPAAHSTRVFSWMEFHVQVYTKLPIPMRKWFGQSAGGAKTVRREGRQGARWVVLRMGAKLGSRAQDEGSSA